MSEPVDPFRRVRACSGTGTLASGNVALACRFEAYQLGGGTIVVEIEADDPTLAHTLSWDVELVGNTPTGQRVVFRGAHVMNATVTIGEAEGTNTKLRLIAAGVEITAPGNSATLRYGLTNLREILGNEIDTYTTPDGHTGGRRRIRLRLGEFAIAIEHRPDAEAVLKELSLTRGVAITAEATVVAAPNQVDAVDEAIRTMCHLLTLGQGSAVCWIYRESVDGHGHVVATFWGNAITKPYGAAHLLISDGDMCSFVQATYPEWNAAETRWEIRNAILGYTDAKIQVDYHELRGLKMAVVIEHLKRVYLERTGREYIISNTLFEKGLEELRRHVMKILRELFPSQTGETLGYLVAGLRGFNRTSFKAAIKGVAAELGLTVEREELGTLVRVRDRLVHAMQFSKESGLTSNQQYDLLTTFAGKLILAALGYDGRYYDWTSRPPALANLERGIGTRSSASDADTHGQGHEQQEPE